MLPWTERVRRGRTACLTGFTGEGCDPQCARLICGKPPSFLDPRFAHDHAEQPLLELLGRPPSSLASMKAALAPPCRTVQFSAVLS